MLRLLYLAVQRRHLQVTPRYMLTQELDKEGGGARLQRFAELAMDNTWAARRWSLAELIIPLFWRLLHVVRGLLSRKIFICKTLSLSLTPSKWSQILLEVAEVVMVLLLARLISK